MRAHPAGPRHADVMVPGTTAGDRPSTADQLDYLHPTVWPRNASRNASGVVELAGVDVRGLAEQYGTPLFVMDEQDFRARCREHAEAFGDPTLVHYASKAFLSVQVAKWVAEEGLSIDVCSGGELAIALRANFPAERIALHGNNKSVPELIAAVEAGVGGVVLDSFHEIARLDQIARERGVVQPVLIRVTVGVEAHTHEFIATAHEDQKFGFSLSSGDAAEAVRRVLKASGLKLVGLHSHIGSQIFDASGFEVAARRVIGLLADVRKEHGDIASLTVVDLGGGLGIAYTPDDDPPPPAELARQLHNIVQKECEHNGLEMPRIAVEPGRAIVGPGTVTVYEVGTIKDVELDYDCKLVSRAAEPESRAVLCRVVGKHCESGDIVVRDCWLPDDLAPGDLVAIAATGAYCYSMASGYNRLPRPALAAVTDGEARLLLRRETEDDLFRLEV
jgi:diaminopimelate decarboxylase